MKKKTRSLAERTYKADIMPVGAKYKVSPMDMITEQMKKDSGELVLIHEEDDIIHGEDKNPDDFE